MKQENEEFEILDDVEVLDEESNDQNQATYQYDFNFKDQVKEDDEENNLEMVEVPNVSPDVEEEMPLPINSENGSSISDIDIVEEVTKDKATSEIMEESERAVSPKMPSEKTSTEPDNSFFDKKNLMFMGIVFLILIIVIILLPYLLKILG